MTRRTRISVATAGAAVVALTAGTFALGGGNGLIFDDGTYVKPGLLDDGKDLLPQTRITVAQADAAAQRARSGPLGQVDLKRVAGRVVYVVDVGDKEVSVDAMTGAVTAIGRRS